MKNRTIGAFALCAAVFAVNEARAKTWEIPAPDGVGDVVALTNACKNCGNSDTISLAAGLYDLSGVSMKSASYTSHLAIGVRTGIKIQGAEGTTREGVVLKGGGEATKLRIISCDRKTTFRGLTFTGGYASGSGGVYSSDGSGANDPRSTVFRDCIFSNNYASSIASVLYRVNIVSNCLFIANRSAGSSVVELAATAPKAMDCDFICNTGDYKTVSIGGSFFRCNFVSNVSARTSADSTKIACILNGIGCANDCEFIDNQIKGENGELKFVGLVYGANAFTNCVFRGNSSQVGAVAQTVGALVDCMVVSNVCKNGGLLKSYDSVVGNVLRCTFVGNRASGRLVYDTSQKFKLNNCLFLDNCTTNGNTGATLANGVTARNCTVIGQVNKETQVFGSDSVLVNTLIYGSYAHDVSQAASATMTNCMWGVQNSSDPVPKTKAVDCIWLKGRDPRFVDPAKGDFRLQRGSIARNAGYQDEAYLAAVGPVDLGKSPRVYEGDGSAKAIIDIGCYECQLPAPGLMMLVR